MTKKETIVIVASVLLFVLLVFLMYFETKHPEGGVEMLNSFLRGILNR